MPQKYDVDDRDVALGAYLHQQTMQSGQGSEKSAWTRDQLELLKHYTEDKTIPERIQNQFWSVFSKNLLFSFLDPKEDIALIDAMYTIVRIDYLIGRHPDELTFDDINNLNQMRLYFYFAAKRAMGTTKQVMNERTLENTQINQSISQSSGSFGVMKNKSARSNLGRFMG